ncbi:MAG: isomerase, partial [Methyloprofundus sp.]|nr:isomerase [Methyloprofundus sp.]
MMNNFISTKVYTLLAVLLLISGCTSLYQSVTPQSIDFEALYGESKPKQRFLTESEVLAEDAISYHKEIKPLLDARCVACHACYDAPCQLKLGSTAGIDRGATKQLVYDAARLKQADPTRLFIDAANTQAWREKDFYPVLNERVDSTQAALNNSLLAKLIELKRSNPLPETGKLADSFDISLNREQSCPSISEFSGYKKKHPDWGMPYAMPGLNLKQEYTLMAWLQQGAKFDAPPPLSAAGHKSVAQWELFFNRPSLKQQLVSRYIYEHLFIGNIHFKDHPKEEFYRLVRSETPSGQPVKEIATLLPYGDPKVSQFYYRLRPVEETIVEKTHMVYELGSDKMQRYETLFFQADYQVTKLPSYQADIAADPLVAYAEIPAELRYQFLLDDAQFFVSGFIKGPVCRGQTALGSIRDRFWVAFFNPKGNKKVPGEVKAVNKFITKEYANLSLPGIAGDDLGFWGFKKYDDLAEQYLKNKDDFANQLIDHMGGFDMDSIWDGEGVNKNAALTVFRHFDSATVVQGFVGDTPLTAWLVDYPIFERIHYLLVAGFDVYSSIDHKLAARTYMDFFRIDGENNFLRFMPNDQRNKMHDSWYKGMSGKLISYLDTPYYSEGHETGVRYQTTDYKKEFFEQLKKRLGKAAGDKDVLNQC